MERTLRGQSAGALPRGRLLGLTVPNTAEGLASRKVLREVCQAMRRLLERDLATGTSDESPAVAEAALAWGLRLIVLQCLQVRGLQNTRSVTAGARGVADCPSTFAAAARDLPGVFDPTCQALALAPSADCLAACQSLLERGTAPFMAPDAPGWAYQYWRGQDQAAIFRSTRRAGAKIEGANLALATQLYTEPYMSTYLLDQAFAHCEGLGGLSAVESLRPRILDPACGSGLLLLAVFERLYAARIRQAPRIDSEELCRTILTECLFGVDLDRRAVDLAVAVLWMRARELAPGLTPDVAVALSQHLVATDFTIPAPDQVLAHFLAAHPAQAPARPALATLLTALAEAAEIGGLIDPTPLDDDCRLQLGAFLVPTSGAKPAALLEVLAGGFHLVIANPPFLGRKHMSVPLRDHLARHHPMTRRDLLAAFVERCFALAAPGGRVALVTLKSWLYQTAYQDFRRQVFRDTTLEHFADLGADAFEPAAGLHAGVTVLLACFRRAACPADHHTVGLRVTDLRGPVAKAAGLQETPGGPDTFRFRQRDLLDLPQAPLIYWLPARVSRAIATFPTLRGAVKQGLATTDNERFLRFAWEIPESDGGARWRPCARGGTYQKWAGLDFTRVDWRADGVMIKAVIAQKYPYLQGGWSWVAKNAGLYFRPGLSYSYMCYGSLSARLMRDSIFEVAGIAVFPDLAVEAEWSPAPLESPPTAEDEPTWREALALGMLNSHVASWILRALAQKHMFQAGLTERLPLPRLTPQVAAEVVALVRWCVTLKRALLQGDLREGACEPDTLIAPIAPAIARVHHLEAWLHAAEGLIEARIAAGYGLGPRELATLTAELGTPAGWHPLRTGQILPEIPRGVPPVPTTLLDHLATHPRRRVDTIAHWQARVRTAHAKIVGSGGGIRAARREKEDGDDAEALAPRPTETTLEAVSSQLAWHPLAVLTALDPVEGGSEIVAEEREWLAEALSLAVMQVLGQRFPAGSPARGDGATSPVLPLVAIPGWPTLMDLLTPTLAALFPGLGPSDVDSRVTALLGEGPEEWLTETFFRRHVTRFRRRPIAWQLTSRPTGRMRPAFTCLVWAHGLGELLAVLRDACLAPLREVHATDPARLAELAAFADALALLEVAGFATPGLATAIAAESLDRFSSLDGLAAPPVDQVALHAQESAYHPSPHDGVRVNIAPWQQARLLAVDVLAKEDAARAIAQRAHWRAAERAACRQGLFVAPAWWPPHPGR